MSATLLHEKFDPLSLFDPEETGTQFKTISAFQQRLEREEFEARRAKTTVENWRAISNTRERLPKAEPTAERFATVRRHERRAANIHTTLICLVYLLLVSCAGFAMAVLLKMV